MPKVDPREFYIEASKRLLGTMKFERAIQRCLLYLQEFIPADVFSVQFFDGGLGVLETVVDATPEASEPMSQLTTLDPEARELVQMAAEEKQPRCIIIDRLMDNPMSRQGAMDFGAPDASALVMDLVVDDEFLGIVDLISNDGAAFCQEHADLLESIHDPLAMACSQFRRYRDLRRLQESLSDNVRQLQKDLMCGVGDEVIGAEFGLEDVMGRAEQVAAQDSSVLILGETGVGKEVVAWAIHRLSPRREGPFIKVNCGAIPPGLIESELFGHEKGAFTGAISQRRGCFERADGGTLLLDEIGELSAEAQVRLLRVLQDRSFERVGGSTVQQVDVRLLAATNRDLESMVEEGRFRRDLLFRINVFPIRVPPLRERRFDIPALAHHLVRKKAREMALPAVPSTRPGAIDFLTGYDWPGNVRELENVIERELILRPEGPLTFADFQPRRSRAEPVMVLDEGVADATLDEVVIQHITRTLHQTCGKVEGPGGAAELLAVNPRTLQNKMKKLGIPFGRRAKEVYLGSSTEVESS